MKRIFFAVFVIACAPQIFAAVRLPKILSSHMVLQRDQPLKIWGWADKSERITVSFNGQTVKTRANNKGEWELALKPMAFGGPYELVIEGKNKITLSDILIGDVWICSGQSNMEWQTKNTNNAAKEIAESNFPGIRLFTVEKETSYRPLDDVKSDGWLVCSPSTVAEFSAVAYFFGRKINQDMNIPVGLINSSWGGTNIQAWISWDSMSKKEGYGNVDFSKMERDKAGMEEQMKKFRASLLNDPGEQEKWFDPAVSVPGWKAIELPQAWEQSAIGNADGIVWFRKEFDLPAVPNGKDLTLSLGPVDDIDVTYINGKKVGSTTVWNTDRVYHIDPSFVRPGKNVIMVKVTDTGGGGGINGKPEQLFIESGDKKITLSGTWEYKPSVISTAFGVSNAGPNGFPSQLFNAMIAPLTRYAVAGGLWYQGESNAGEAYRYRVLFPEMIRDWRNKWGYEFSFYWVQLANFMAPDKQPAESDWAELREAQSMTLGLPQTGQAVIIDIGEENDIHPRNKQDVGYRLALAAEKVTYKKDLVYSGPVYQSMKKEGDKIILTFENVGSGLTAKDKYGYLKGFAIAGEDKRFVWARAWIEGNQVIVSSENISNPVAVRYAWGNNPDDANLYNKEGLPASPFRTDTWRGISQGYDK